MIGRVDLDGDRTPVGRLVPEPDVRAGGGIGLIDLTDTFAMRLARPGKRSPCSGSAVVVTSGSAAVPTTASRAPSRAALSINCRIITIRPYSKTPSKPSSKTFEHQRGLEYGRPAAATGPCFGM